MRLGEKYDAVARGFDARAALTGVRVGYFRQNVARENLVARVYMAFKYAAVGAFYGDQSFFIENERI